MQENKEEKNYKLLSIQDLHVHYYTYAGVVHAVNSAYLELDRGEVVGVVGETGCGKSTMGLAVVGLIIHPGKIVKGKIYFDGEELTSKTPEEMKEIRRKKISYIFQDPTAALNPVIRVGFQIAEGIMATWGLNKDEAIDKAIELLKMTGIPEPEKVVEQYPHELSGGMRQRAVIAIALSKRPQLIIADEPTSNLDVTIQAQILDLMMDLKKKVRTAIMLVTHDMGVVAQTCEKIAVMYAGTVVEYTGVKEMFKNPLHPYTKGLLKVVNLVGWRTRLDSIPGTVPNLINPPKGCLFYPRCNSRMDICKEVRPKLIEVQPNHYIACHLYKGQ
jgi:peptide/nickel transport system ATP-binding protein